MKLYLIRHAHAGQGNPNDPHDNLRPLSAKGKRQTALLVRAFSHLEISLDRLFSSPYTRATETATPLVQHAKTGTLETLPELTTGAYNALLGTLKGVPDESHTAFVGHEPYLSGFVSYALTGDARRVALRFRKGMLVELRGPPEAGRLELHSALTPRQLGALAQTPWTGQRTLRSRTKATG